MWLEGKTGFPLSGNKDNGDTKQARGDRAMTPRATTARLQKRAHLTGLGIRSA